MTDFILPFVIGLCCLAVGAAVGFFIRKLIAEARIGQAEDRAKEIIAEAEIKADAARKEAALEAKEELLKMLAISS